MSYSDFFSESKHQNLYSSAMWETFLSSVMKQTIRRMYLHPVDLILHRKPLKIDIDEVQQDMIEEGSESMLSDEEEQFLRSITWKTPIFNCSRLFITRSPKNTHFMTADKHITYQWMYDLADYDTTDPHSNLLNVEDVTQAIYRLKQLKYDFVTESLAHVHADTNNTNNNAYTVTLFVQFNS